MNVLVLGATGYIGSAVVRRLTRDGHQVVALARSGSSPVDPTARVGDLADPDSLRAAVTDDIDAVLHLATPTGREETDAAAVDALLDRLRGTGRPFVYTSGVWVLGVTGDRVADESSATDPLDIVGYRPRIERRVLAAADADVRAVVLRPGIAYGHGGGIPAMMVGWAREHGHGRYVGTAGTRWPMVHVDDLAALYALALDKAAPGSVLHGIALPAVPTAALAAAADVAAGGTGRAEPWPVEQAVDVFGEPFARALAADQTVSADRTATDLGWRPRERYVTSDLVAGSYT
ncbi:NAD-dependent epimerase/dehydratase family protein [Longispora sp. K20-0274]|uniref:NAD-dependent epimerase/dehydratase family protein n=1 Tax=Longispora sp. K20-0274 TaxID=3088255 RepID=UPI00399A9DE9